MNGIYDSPNLEYCIYRTTRDNVTCCSLWCCANLSSLYIDKRENLVALHCSMQTWLPLYNLDRLTLHIIQLLSKRSVNITYKPMESSRKFSIVVVVLLILVAATGEYEHGIYNFSFLYDCQVCRSKTDSNYVHMLMIIILTKHAKWDFSLDLTC
jgi:hypothetical protein